MWKGWRAHRGQKKGRKWCKYCTQSGFVHCAANVTAGSCGGIMGELGCHNMDPITEEWSVVSGCHSSLCISDLSSKFFLGPATRPFPTIPEDFHQIGPGCTSQNRWMTWLPVELYPHPDSVPCNPSPGQHHPCLSMTLLLLSEWVSDLPTSRTAPIYGFCPHDSSSSHIFPAILCPYCWAFLPTQEDFQQRNSPRSHKSEQMHELPASGIIHLPVLCLCDPSPAAAWLCPNPSPFSPPRHRLYHPQLPSPIYKQPLPRT